MKMQQTGRQFLLMDKRNSKKVQQSDSQYADRRYYMTVISILKSSNKSASAKT